MKPEQDRMVAVWNGKRHEKGVLMGQADKGYAEVLFRDGSVRKVQETLITSFRSWKMLRRIHRAHFGWLAKLRILFTRSR